MKNATRYSWIAAIALVLILPAFAMADHRGRGGRDYGGHDRGGSRVDVSIGLGFNFSNYDYRERGYYTRVYEAPVRIYAPAPVYCEPAPVYCPPPAVVYSPPPVVYYAPRVYYSEPCAPRTYYGSVRYSYRR